MAHDRVFRNPDAASKTGRIPSIDQLASANDDEVIQVLDARVFNMLRLYDSTRHKRLVDKETKRMLKSYIGALGKEDRVQLYGLLRAYAFIFDLEGNSKEYDRHLEAADYLRRSFRLKSLPAGKQETKY
ncbi:hypothetical protein J4234_06835 [Candidatus Woesearchaeota archaeon]|nr:hypothetical protein [Candidatus Woesearchaeota archaeon]